MWNNIWVSKNVGELFKNNLVSWVKTWVSCQRIWVRWPYFYLCELVFWVSCPSWYRFALLKVKGMKCPFARDINYNKLINRERTKCPKETWVTRVDVPKTHFLKDFLTYVWIDLYVKRHICDWLFILIMDRWNC